MNLFSSPLVFLAVLSLGCDSSARTVKASDPFSHLKSATSITLYSLDGFGKGSSTQGKSFHDYPSLGKVTITDPQTVSVLYDALNSAYQNKPDKIPACFIPRHGLSCSYQDYCVDYVICLECKQFETHVDGKMKMWHMSDTPATLLNQLFRDANIPLPSK
jgi:translation initiation factor 2 beta subunit (eIF-2beta)/eIF-5